MGAHHCMHSYLMWWPAELAKIECDVSHGRWVADPTPPIYTNETCWQIQDTQNCLRNGRPDTKFLFWKWKPHGSDCDTLRPNATRFLDSMRGKRLAFVGDSIARNQMQSLLCILTQVRRVQWIGFPCMLLDRSPTRLSFGLIHLALIACF